MGLAHNLMILRKNHFMSVAELAKEISKKEKVTRVAVNQWERGASKPNEKYMKVICEIFGVTLSQLHSDDISKEQRKEEERQTQSIIDYRDEVISLLKDRVARLEKDLAEAQKKKGS